MTCAGHKRVRELGLAGPEVSDAEIERRLMQATILLTDIWQDKNEMDDAVAAKLLHEDDESDDPFDG